MKRVPHLNAAIIAMGVLVMSLAGFSCYSQSLEQRYVNALAPLDLPQTINGSALQGAALARPDLLPVYGSSEMIFNDSPYKAEKLFATYPTGFTIINVAQAGASSLTMAQDLAALGPALQGKKVVVSITPMLFTFGVLPEEYYAGNYSRLHAYGLIFSPELSLELKSAAAGRMLAHPKTLENDPFFEFTLSHMTDTKIQSRLFYVIMWPLGELQTEMMRLQDHAEVVRYVWGHRLNPNVARLPQEIDWAGDLSTALTEQKLSTLSNAYGIEDPIWNSTQIRYMALPLAPGSGDAAFLRFLQDAKEWPDFKILLDVLQELGPGP
ncbi:MAG TPA: D-alanyl-lipoteichoic acid biosynthesis protein DltD [Anaerolineales bacterium]|nr:D-alanyl-lipoteichoic acid biosynthesis protein DltD [Anaerolineales bacterium]